MQAPRRMLSKFTLKKKMIPLPLKLVCVKFKWLLVCSYNPQFSNLPVHLNPLDKSIVFYSKTYDNILITWQFNAEVSDLKLDTFCSIWNLKSLGKKSTCFKNSNNLSFVDLFLTDTIRSFQVTQVFKNGLSDSDFTFIN